MFQKQKDLDALVRARVERTRTERKTSRACIDRATPLEAEDDPKRRRNFAAHMDRLVHDLTGAENIQGDTIDYVDAFFLTVGARAARAVAHVSTSEGRTSLGTGFLVSPDLFLTNHHVLLDEESAAAAWITFDYEKTERLEPRDSTVFKLDPGKFFFHDPWQRLDFALVAIGERVRGPLGARDFGFCQLRDSVDRHAKGVAVNIVEHPNGGFKKLVLRENRIVARSDFTLHYEADTEPGSSGSPVFNDGWEVVALHHWGKPRLETRTIDGREIPITVNEGIRSSKIVERLREHLSELRDQGKIKLLTEALAAAPRIVEREGGEAVENEGVRVTPRPARSSEVAVNVPAHGQGGEVSIVVPLQVSFRLLPPTGLETPATPRLDPGAPRTVVKTPETAPVSLAPTVVGPERIEVEKPYTNRRGYDPDFLGVRVPLPTVERATWRRSSAETARESFVTSTSASS